MPKRGWLLLPFAAAPIAACQIIAGLDGPLAEALRDATVAPDVSRTDGSVIEAEAGPRDGGGDPAAYAAAVLADTPVAYYRFDESAGSTCADATGQGSDANLTGPFGRGRPSIVAGSGASAHLDSSAKMPLDPKFDYPYAHDSTIEFWVRPDRFDAGGTLLSNLVPTPPRVGSIAYLKTKAPFVGYERWDDNLARYAHANTPVVLGPSGALHLVLVVQDSIPALFVNGTRYRGNLNEPDAGSSPLSLVLGGLAGDYDELAIYDKALSEARIALHYGKGVGD